MDEIRRIIGEMDEEENELLRQRDQRAKATARFATSAMIFGGILVLVSGLHGGRASSSVPSPSRWRHSCSLWGEWERAT